MPVLSRPRLGFWLTNTPSRRVGQPGAYSQPRQEFAEHRDPIFPRQPAKAAKVTQKENECPYVLDSILQRPPAQQRQGPVRQAVGALLHVLPPRCGPSLLQGGARGL